MCTYMVRSYIYPLILTPPTPEGVIIRQPKTSFLPGAVFDVDHDVEGPRREEPQKLILIDRIEQTCRVGWAGPLQTDWPKKKQNAENVLS